MARATTSRGASDASGWYSSMNEEPSIRRRTAPSPRTASEIRKVRSRAGYSAVGWNWTNSMFATLAPARYAMATPSPVAMAGLVVWR